MPPEVAHIYGETPTELDVRLPLDELHEVFPQFYKLYGLNHRLKEICDGEYTKIFEGDEVKAQRCSHGKEEHDRMITATLNFMLPKVSLAGIYQIDTGSVNSIIKLNSSIRYIKALFGRVVMLPLKLILEPQEVHYEGKKTTAYTMRLSFDQNEVFETLKRRGEDLKVISELVPLSLPEPETPPTEETQEENTEEVLPNEDFVDLDKSNG